MEINQVWPEWQIVEAIGQGSYGTVYKCVNGEGTYSAVKVISVPQSELELKSGATAGMTDEQKRSYFKEIIDDFVNEINLLEELKGAPNIVGIEDSKVIEKTTGIGWQIFIRMELLTDFQTYLNGHVMTEDEIIRLGIDICNALTVCGEKSIIHRDIKPENIFVDSEGNFKLGDFGVAKQLEKTEASMSRRGTYNYMAPEVLSAKHYDSRADIYSLGIVMYKLLNKNRLPFIDPTKQMVKYSERQEAFERRIHGEKIPPINDISPELNKIVLQACAFKPEDRFRKVMDLKEALKKLNSSEQDESPKFISWVKGNKLKASISLVLAAAIITGSTLLIKKGIGSGDNPDALTSLVSIVANKDAQSFLDGKKTGDTVNLGEYPQSLVEDEKLKDKLNDVEKNWVAYDYYVGGEASEYMEYADIKYKDDKYRAVRFSQDAENTEKSEIPDRYAQQKINGYSNDEACYYFKYEPVEWRIIDIDSGTLISEYVIDAQPFQNETENKDGTEYVHNSPATDYYVSSVQAWLNDGFYFSAFSEKEKKLIRNNRHESETVNGSESAGTLFAERISMLTHDIAVDTLNSSERTAQSTDYAKCQGCVCGKNGNTSWWLRSPKKENEMFIVDVDGSISSKNVKYTDVGIRPVVELFSIVSQDKDVKSKSDNKKAEDGKSSETSSDTNKEEKESKKDDPKKETQVTFNAQRNNSQDSAMNNSGTNNSASQQETVNKLYRVVLTWGGQVSDLDLHLYCDCGTSETVNYNCENWSGDNGSFASLDLDDTSGYGPEVATLCVSDYGSYICRIYNYSQELSITDSEAHVAIYSDDEEITSFDVPAFGEGTTWKVFEIVNGEIITLNEIE